MNEKYGVGLAPEAMALKLKRDLVRDVYLRHGRDGDVFDRFEKRLQEFANQQRWFTVTEAMAAGFSQLHRQVVRQESIWPDTDQEITAWAIEVWDIASGDEFSPMALKRAVMKPEDHAAFCMAVKEFWRR